jgi:hypothetical protein
MGHFLPGVSPNPTGRPPIDPEVRAQLNAIFEAASVDAATKLAALIQDKDSRVATAACIAILDRLLGKPSQSIDATIKTGSVQAAHLAALAELRRRREGAPAPSVGRGGASGEIIDITPVIEPKQDQ